MQHPLIKKVTLISASYGANKPQANGEITLRIAEVLPQLEDIDFAEFQLTVESAIQFIGICISLKRICFKIANRSEFDRLMASLVNNWKVVADNAMRHITVVIARQV